MNTTKNKIVTIGGKRGEYTGYEESTKKHYISLYSGEVLKLDTLDNVKFDKEASQSINDKQGEK